MTLSNGKCFLSFCVLVSKLAYDLKKTLNHSILLLYFQLTRKKNVVNLPNSKMG